jgi:hypothetical protein
VTIDRDGGDEAEMKTEIRIVDIRDGRTNYALSASLNAEGDLVVSGSDLSRWAKDALATDEYEYFYVVKAAHLARLCAALGADCEALLGRIRHQLAPHGYHASTAWKTWLNEHGIPYEFSVWR